MKTRGMKTITATLLAICLACSFAFPALALPASVRYVRIADWTASISDNGNNTASIYTQVNCTSDVNKAVITVALQHEKNGAFSTIRTKSKTFYDCDGIFTFDTPIHSGENYRIYVTYKAYVPDSNTPETHWEYSSSTQ